MKDEVVPAGHISARKAEGADPACTCRTYTGSFTLTFRHGRHGHRPERQQPRARATYPVRRGPGGAAATRTKFSRRLRHLAFKCWLSERSAASELEPSRRSVLSLAGQVILRPILRLAAVCCESRQLYRTRRCRPNPIIRYTWVLQKYRVGGSPSALRTSSLALRRNWLTASSISSCPCPLLGNDMN